MLSFDRILFPTDFSETARRALPYAAHLADHHDAALHILHARTPGHNEEAPASDDLPSTADELVEWARRAAEELGLFPAASPHPSTVTRATRTSDSVREAVVGYAEEQHTDLMVMGTTRQQGAPGLFPRSTAASVVRHAPCPVLTVAGEREPSPQPIDQLFVPYDFSTHANRAVRHAEDLATLYESDVTLVHVIEEPMVPAEYGVEVPSLDVQSVRSRAKAALRGVSDEEHRILVASGHPAQRIVELAEDRHADLLVLATHGRTGLRRMLIGSVAEQVLRDAPCPVFIVKAFDSSAE